MKNRHRPPSCLNLNRTLVPSPATNVTAASLSFGPHTIRHRSNTMKTQAEKIGVEFSAWTVRAPWIWLGGFMKRGRLDCDTDGRLTGAPRGRGGASVGRMAVRATAALELEQQGLTVDFTEAGNFAGPTLAQHLWLVSWSAEPGRSNFWETAAFLVIWVSGLIGVAVCLL